MKEKMTPREIMIEFPAEIFYKGRERSLNIIHEKSLIICFITIISWG